MSLALNTLWKAIFIIFVVWTNSQTEGYECYNRLLDEVIITSRTWYTAQVDNTTLKANITAHVRWNVSSSPAGLELDGFVVKFQDSNTMHEDSKSILASNVCIPKGSLFWVNASNKTHCSNETSLCSNSTAQDCLCATKCKLFNYSSRRSRNCDDVGSSYIKDYGYFAVQSFVRYLEFNVDMASQKYDAYIVPYSRQFTGNFPNSDQVIEMPRNWMDVFTNMGYSHHDAASILCANSIAHHYARNFTFHELVPDFNQLTLSLNVSWLLPIDSKGLLTFFVSHLHGEYGTSSNRTFIATNETRRSARTSCVNNTQFQITVENVKPTHNYTYAVTSWYDRSRQLCAIYGSCSTDFTLQVPEFNACEKRYNLCDQNANCTAQDRTGRTSINATCVCLTGFVGNGYNPSSVKGGTGCNDINACRNDTNPCDNHAECKDRRAPYLDANCTCLSGYYGDGLKNGSGCSSSALHALSIALPVVFVALILLGALVWMIRERRIERDNFKWSKFVSNSALQYALPQLDKGDNEWLPTFGDRWELARDKVQLGDVLGRGNYGIVYKATMAEDSVNDDLVKVTTVDVETRSVAVKVLKEGPNESSKIMDFLAEIGFMLNLGEHPHVVKVLGCCTTQKPIYLVTEFLAYGDLLHFLWDAREPTKCFEDPLYHLTEKSVYEMSRQLAQGMSYLTKSKIIHGDLAARNILVGENRVCKISDFGLANDVYRYGVIKGQMEKTVPFKWISPERMMSGKVPITSKSDVWSFGNLMFEMVTLGCMPHATVPSDQLLEKLRSGYRMKQPVSCGGQMYTIMKACWEWRASSRPSFDRLDKMLSNALITNAKMDYVNIVKVVDSIDKEKYEEELDPQFPGKDEEKQENGELRESFYIKQPLSDDMANRELDKTTIF